MLLLQDYTCLTVDEVLEIAQTEVKSHSVGLVYIKPHSGGLSYDELHRGSGTLVQWHDEFGILTAAHVANLVDFGSNVRLRVPVLGCGHSLSIPCCELKEAAKFYRQGGPDIALITLPSSPMLSQLWARKLFLNLTVRTEQKLRESVGSAPSFLLSGGPGKLSQNHPPDHGFSRLVDSPSMRFEVLSKNRVTENGFDYVEVEADCDKTVGVDTLEGVSGAGLWRLIVTKSEVEGRFHYHHAALAGVAFGQREKKPDGTRIVRCHGGESIFKRLLPAVTGRQTTN